MKPGRKPLSVSEALERGMARAIEVGECLEWQGKMGNSKTIPVIQSREGKTYSAEYSVPRELWIREKGPIPKGLVLYRKCCNNQCVNIKHFAVGTRAEWIENRKRNGLTKHRPDHIVNLTMGARNRANIVNSLEKAREVRALIGEYRVREIAAMTGVSEAMVVDIGRNRAWRDQSNPFAGLLGHPG